MPKKCETCGGDSEKHPWPEGGPYVRGCVEELKRQIDDLLKRLDDNGIYANGEGSDL